MQRSATERNAFKLTRSPVVVYEYFNAFAEQSCRNPASSAGVQQGTGVCHDHTMESDIVGRYFDGCSFVIVGRKRPGPGAGRTERRNFRDGYCEQGLRP